MHAKIGAVKKKPLRIVLPVNNTFNKRETQHRLDEHWWRVLMAKPKVETTLDSGVHVTQSNSKQRARCTQQLTVQQSSRDWLKNRK